MHWASRVALLVKNLPQNAGGGRDARSPGREGPLGAGMATHPSILAWRPPRTGKPGGLQSIGVAESRIGLNDLARHTQHVIHYV